MQNVFEHGYFLFGGGGGVELPVPRNARKRKKKSGKKNTALVGSSEVNQMSVEVC
jgi:hypothetical protein